MTEPPDEASPVAAMLLFRGALWFGITYGLLEGTGLVLVGLVPWAAAPLNGTTAGILWLDPIFYVTLFGLIGLLFALSSRTARRLRWDTGLLFLLVAISVYLAVDIQDHRLSNLASAVLAAGVALQVTRWFRSRRQRWTMIMTRSLPYLIALAIVVGLASFVGPQAVEAVALRAARAHDATRPNVLLLIVDTLRADHLTSYGYARPTTPRLDHLASEGILFEQAHSPSSWTLPSHASIMTGRLPHEHRAGDPRRPFLDRRFPTVAERFRDAGYATGAFVSNTFWAGEQMGLGRGFATYRDYMTTARDAITRPVAGRKFGWELAPRFGWRLFQRPSRADWIHEELTDWIDGLAGRSFFAFVNYMDVHGPYLGTPPFTTMFGGAGSSNAPVLLAPTNDREAAEATGRLRESINSYDGSLAYLDHEIGALLDGFNQRGLGNDTVIVVTSDHGESFGEHGFVNHGNSLYLDQTHVPLVIRFPGRVAAGVRVRQPVSLTQLPDTLLSLSGQRLSPLATTPLSMTDEDARSSDSAVITEVSQRRLVPRTWPSAHGWLKALVTDRWHFILAEDGKKELYDPIADPREEHNRVNDSDLSTVVAELERKLRSAAMPAEHGPRVNGGGRPD